MQVTYNHLMPNKTYEMYCAVARALEILGERWTILIVRELLTGPKRFADLQNGLPGIATNVLAARLRSLQEAEVIAKRVLPPPAASTIYELTNRGRDLKPVLLSLASWGTPSLGLPRKGEQFRLAWLMIALDGSYNPKAAEKPLTISIKVGEEEVTIRAHGSSHEVVEGPTEDADLTIQSNQSTFLAWATGHLSNSDAIAAGMKVTDGIRGLNRLRLLYPLPAAGARPFVKK